LDKTLKAKHFFHVAKTAGCQEKIDPVERLITVNDLNFVLLDQLSQSVRNGNIYRNPMGKFSAKAVKRNSRAPYLAFKRPAQRGREHEVYSMSLGISADVKCLGFSTAAVKTFEQIQNIHKYHQTMTISLFYVFILFRGNILLHDLRLFWPGQKADYSRKVRATRPLPGRPVRRF
jgi:hypothetical protein